MVKPYLDPANQAFVNALEASGLGPLEDLSVKKTREAIDQLQQHNPIPGVNRTEIDVLFDRRTVKTYVFRPEHVKVPLPVIFFIHGGGFYFGNVETHDSICREIVLQTGCAIVFPEYTLAPEKRFPTQIDEVYTVAQYVQRHGAQHKLKTDAFSVVGDSAGATLSIVLSLLASSRKPKIPLVYQVLFSPLTDLNFEKETLSGFEFFSGPFIDWLHKKKIDQLYLTTPSQKEDILASPLLMSKEQASKQPPTTIVVSSADPIRSEGEAFGHLLQQNGVDCTIVRAEGQIHDAYILESTRTSATPMAMVKLASLQIKEAFDATTTGKDDKKVAGEEKSAGRPARKRKRAL